MRRAIRRREIPDLEEIEGELQRLHEHSNYCRALSSTLRTLVIVAAVAAIIATLCMPVLRVSGTSMLPSLGEGDIVLCLKTDDIEIGQVCCFYYNNKLLLKRVIAKAGDWVEIDAEGFVFVNGMRLEEPYLQKHSLGICDITFPYQVPDGGLFVLGDQRDDSLDSRNSAVGCIGPEQIVGRVFGRLWPLKSMGIVR